MLVRHQGRWIVAAEPSERLRDWECFGAVSMPVADRRVAAPMAGGWIGMFSYDAGGMLERLPEPLPDPGGPRRATLARYDAVFAVDDDGSWEIQSTGARAARRLADAVDTDLAWPEVPAPPPRARPVPSLPRARHVAAVERARELIRAGDCYQVNLAMRLVEPWDLGAAALAAALWDAAGPSEYRAFLTMPEGTLVSASPELLVRTDPAGPAATSSPIKGTAPPGGFATLAASAKDRAEHIMIVDLLRNDLGRVAAAGGVAVPRLLDRLTTPYAEHLVSDVVARLRPGTSPAEILAALLPGGSVTGCPKIRSMEVIRDLEPVSRGPAFGSAVAVGRDGSLDASVLIRTAWLTGDEVRYWCGGAVVWDSDPDREHDEAWVKATPFLRAIGA